MACLVLCCGNRRYCLFNDKPILYLNFSIMKNAGAFTAFKIIHTAMLAGQLMFMGVLFYLQYSKTVTPMLVEQDRILQVIAIIFAAFAFYLGISLFKKKLMAIREDVNLAVNQKFEKYRAACIMQWALLEGAGLFCSLCFFLTGNYAFLALGGVLLLLFIMQAPFKNKMALQLGLNSSEMEEL